MIARIWRGVTSAEQAEEYFAYLIETGLKDYRAVPGNRGVQILRRTTQGKAEFLLISLWESYEVIGAFAGEDRERAVWPRISRRAPSEPAVSPLPKDDTTPPVTKMYFTGYG